MTEEEKEALETLENLDYDEYEWYLDLKNVHSREEAFDKLCRAQDILPILINRLQKENQELKIGLQFRVNYCRKLEQELYGDSDIELTKIEKDYLKENKE